MREMLIAIRAELVADAFLNERVGDNIHIGEIPLRSEMPAMYFRVVSSMATYSLLPGKRHQRARIQVGVRAKRADDALAIADRAGYILDRVAGTSGNVDIQGSTELSSLTMYDFDLDTHGVDTDYAIRFVPTEEE